MIYIFYSIFFLDIFLNVFLFFVHLAWFLTQELKCEDVLVKENGIERISVMNAMVFFYML